MELNDSPFNPKRRKIERADRYNNPYAFGISSRLIWDLLLKSGYEISHEDRLKQIIVSNSLCGQPKIVINRLENDSQLGQTKCLTNGTVHANKEAKENRYKCQVCGKSFGKSSHLKTHTRIHTGEKPYKCQFCDKSFTILSNLQSHTRVHTGEKPYKCQLCGCSFSQTGALKTHTRIHTGKKPYKCNVCSKIFANRSAGITHRSVHTKEKPFK